VQHDCRLQQLQHRKDTGLVKWPGIIKHSGDAELTCIIDQSEWDKDAGLHESSYDDSDYLVDSSGNIFKLATGIDGCVKLESTGEIRTLSEVLVLIKAHASQSGSCCVSRLYAPSIHAAIKIVRSINEL
jgi:hypothetical protein